MPIPTRTSVSRDARPLITRSSSHCTMPFSNKTTIVEPPVTHIERRKHARRSTNKPRTRTKCKVPQFVPSRYRLSLLHDRPNTPYHHRTHTHCHNQPKLGTVYGYNFPSIFSVYVERTSDSLRLYPSVSHKEQKNRSAEAPTLTV